MVYDTEKSTVDLVVNIQMNMTDFTSSTPLRQVTENPQFELLTEIASTLKDCLRACIVAQNDPYYAISREQFRTAFCSDLRIMTL